MATKAKSAKKAVANAVEKPKAADVGEMTATVVPQRLPLKSSAFKQFLGEYSGANAKEKDRLYYSITRGQALLEQALGWRGDVPSAPGPRAGKDGPTALQRGLQWRLCMAWAGFETWMGGLLAKENSKLEAGTLAKWSKGLPAFDSIEAPRTGKAIARWIDEEGGDAILDFLGVNRTDRKTLKTWLMKGQAIADWASMALLSKALRNATAHGALSASTAKQLGLQAALEKLPTLLQDFAHGALRQYLKNSEHPSCGIDRLKNTKGSL